MQCEATMQGDRKVRAAKHTKLNWMRIPKSSKHPEVIAKERRKRAKHRPIFTGKQTKHGFHLKAAKLLAAVGGFRGAVFREAGR